MPAGRCQTLQTKISFSPLPDERPPRTPHHSRAFASHQGEARPPGRAIPSAAPICSLSPGLGQPWNPSGLLPPASPCPAPSSIPPPCILLQLEEQKTNAPASKEVKAERFAPGKGAGRVLSLLRGADAQGRAARRLDGRQPHLLPSLGGMATRPRQGCQAQIGSAPASAGGLGCFLLTAMAPGRWGRIEHGVGMGSPWVTVTGGDPRWNKAASSSPTRSLLALPSSAGRAAATWLIHHQLRGMQEQNQDQGRSPETCSFHRELPRGNKAADARNALACLPRRLSASGSADMPRLVVGELLLLGAGGLFVSFTLSPGLVTARYEIIQIISLGFTAEALYGVRRLQNPTGSSSCR